jgi:DNA polymerase III alpha subunit
MRVDTYSRQILSETDLCELYLRNPDQIVINGTVERPITFAEELDLENIPKLNTYVNLDITVSEFDTNNQNNWYIPESYRDLDIAKFVLDRCEHDYELQRVGEELLLFQERDLFPLLRYCKYLVDTMRSNNIVWGVGRGSSVASYVLFLIGIHRINSIHYDLSIDEFLK